MKEDFNPFPVSGYRGPEYFCDREAETTALIHNLRNSINSTLFSIRRSGKTGLVQHVLSSDKLKRSYICIYTDILSTSNLREFTNQLASVIYNRFPEKTGFGKNLIQALRLLRPKISFDPLSGSPEVTLDAVEPKLYEKTIQQLFTLLDSQNKKVVIAIDEFQQILKYPEKNVEALLRTHIQMLKNTRFIFCGSDQKMMNELFNNVKRPFFASCSNLHLDFIPKEKYAAFILNTFSFHRRKISRESISFILDFTMCHTFYTQYFCNHLYSSGLKKIELADVQRAAVEILQWQEGTFYQYRNLLTSAQWQLLKAIAREEHLYKAHSKDFIGQYKLGTSSMVSRGVEALMNKEMIFLNTFAEKPYYQVYDKFLMRWLQYRYPL